MKIIKHFFQTLLMLAMAAMVALLPRDTMAPYINPILAVAIACVLVFTGIYLYKGHKKGLFVILILTLFASGTVFAQSNDNASGYYRDKLNEYCKDFCAEVDRFDPEQAVKNNEDPNQEMIDNAVKFTDMVERSVAAGYAEKNFWTQLWNGEISGKAPWWQERFSKQYECAAEFLEEVAEYRVLIEKNFMKNVYNLLKADKDTCWPCGIIHLMIDTVEKITLSLEDPLKQAALSLLGIMTLFWILIKVLILIGQFGTASNADFFTELLTRLFLVVIAAAILQAPLTQFYQMTFSPFVSATAKLTQQFTNYGDEAQGIGTILTDGENLKCSCCNDNSQKDCNGGELRSGVLDLEAKRDLMCMTCSIYKQTAPMVASGRVMTYYAIHTGPEKLSLWTKALNGVIEFVSGLVFPYPMGMWFVGIILILTFTWLSFVIAFKSVDLFLRFGFVVLLTPFLITAYVFPISRKYAQRGWEFLMHSMVSLLALGIGIAFTMSIFTTGMPEEFRTTAQEIMTRTNANMGNDYASDLWHAFIGAPQSTAWDSGNGGSFFPLLWMIIICALGSKILNATGVIVEALTGVSAGIPSMAGAAVMGAIRAAYAPFKMAKKVIQDRWDAFKVNSADKGGEKQGALSRFEEWSGAKADKLDNVGKAAGKATQATGDAIEKGGAAAGEATQAAGKGVTASGKGLMGAGKALSATGLGAIVGVPLMIAGAAVAGAGYATQAAGVAVKHASKFAGKAVKVGGKVMEKAGKVANKMAKPLAKGMRATSRFAGKVNKKVQDFKKKARGVKNRMKKMVPPKVRKYFNDRKKNKEENKQNRRKKSKTKYSRTRASALLDNIDNTIEDTLSAGDNSFGK